MFKINDVVEDPSGVLYIIVDIKDDDFVTGNTIYILENSGGTVSHASDYWMSKCKQADPTRFQYNVAGGTLPMGYGNADLSKGLTQRLPETKECKHNWQYYQGFRDTYYYCTKCDLKKDA